MTELVWRKATQSTTQGGDCVELAAIQMGIVVRDSKDPEGPKLEMPRAAFRALVTDLKHL